METRGVVIVGVKHGGGSCRELLTWALAKFTKPGDLLIALHIASTSAVDIHLTPVCRQSDDVFESVTGVYDSFCTSRNIALQFRISGAAGKSARKALVKEAESCAAIRLILGASGAQPPTSFPLARYCSKHLPLTCSVLVIHSGKVVYEKPGDRRKGLDDEASTKRGSKSMRNMMEILQPSSKRASGRQIQTIGGESMHMKACKSRNPASSRGPMCISTDILQSYIHMAPQLQMSKSGAPKNFHLLPPVCANSLQAICLTTHQKRSNEEKPSSYGGGGGHSRSIQKISLQQPSLCSSMNQKIEESQTLLHDNCSTKPKLIGWPLLHHSISMPSSKMPGFHPSPKHNMSVIEWVLQLPERPKPVLLTQSEKHVSVSSQRIAEGNHLPSLQRGNPTQQGRALASKDMSCREFGFMDLQRATDNFSANNMIGKGGCSHVYRGKLSDGRVVAIKYFHSSPDAEKAFLTEMEISRCLEHPQVIQLLGYCACNNHNLLVYNFAAEGNLEQKLHGDKSIVLPWHIRYDAAVGVAKALAYLHNFSRPVIHRDVKSSNIVLLSDLTPQLIDFGLAIWAPTASPHITCNDVLGTFGYLAPEYFMYGKVNEKTDVYAFGVVLLELISGKHPLNTGISQENLVTWAKPFLRDESRFAQIVDQKLNGEYNACQLQTMVSAAALCLRQSYLARPSMAKIVQLLKEGSIDLEESKCLDDGDGPLIFDDRDLHSHLTVALYGLDDDTSNDESMDFTNSKTFIEEYLQQRHNHPQF